MIGQVQPCLSGEAGMEIIVGKWNIDISYIYFV